MSLIEWSIWSLSANHMCVLVWGRRLGRQTNVQGHIYCIYVESFHGCTRGKWWTDQPRLCRDPTSMMMCGENGRPAGTCWYCYPSVMDPHFHRCNIDGWEVWQFLLIFIESLSLHPIVEWVMIAHDMSGSTAPTFLKWHFGDDLLLVRKCSSCGLMMDRYKRRLLMEQAWMPALSPFLEWVFPHFKNA